MEINEQLWLLIGDNFTSSRGHLAVFGEVFGCPDYEDIFWVNAREEPFDIQNNPHNKKLHGKM